MHNLVLSRVPTVRVHESSSLTTVLTQYVMKNVINNVTRDLGSRDAPMPGDQGRAARCAKRISRPLKLELKAVINESSEVLKVMADMMNLSTE